jgi:transcriptional regulator with XRE-family HTH domain
MKLEAIKSYRQRLGLTQVQLAERFGVSANTIARWERGEVRPEAPEMVLLAFRGLEIEMGLDKSGEIKRLMRKVDENLSKAAAAL